jgi:hypothetical protein
MIASTAPTERLEMAPEMRQRLDAFMENIGRGGKRYDTHDPAVKGGQNSPALLRRGTYLPGDPFRPEPDVDGTSHDLRLVARPGDERSEVSLHLPPEPASNPSQFIAPVIALSEGGLAPAVVKVERRQVVRQAFTGCARPMPAINLGA